MLTPACPCHSVIDEAPGVEERNMSVKGGEEKGSDQ
jgi:hypothetical protein